MPDPDLFARKLAARQQPADEWPPLLPLEGDTGTLPPFPTHVLPQWIADMVDDVADELQVAADLPAMLALAALATICAGKVDIAVRQTWLEPTNLYLVIALPPGAGKSPAFKAMIGALEAYQTQLRRDSEAKIARIEQERRVLTTAMKRAEDKGDLTEARIILNDLDTLQVPARPRLIIDDATPEALVARLHEQGGRLALMSSEGGLFDMITGRYSDKTNLDPYLQAWSGDTINVDRIGRESITITRPLLTVGLTVQPTVIERLAARPELAGRGLTARFMYSIPADTVGYRDMTRPDRTASLARNIYATRLTDIARSAGTWEQPVTLRFDDTATALFAEWRQHIEHRRRPDGDLYAMREWTTKLESSVARTAALLAIADGNRTTDPIDVETLKRALTIGRYWIEHARAVHGAWGASKTQADALAIWRWLQAHGHTEITERDLWRGVRRRFDEVKEFMEPALKYLTESGHIKRVRVTKAGDTSGDAGARKTAVIVVRPPENGLIGTASPLSLETKISTLSLSLSVPPNPVKSRATDSGAETRDSAATGDTNEVDEPGDHTEWTPTDEELPF